MEAATLGILIWLAACGGDARPAPGGAAGAGPDAVRVHDAVVVEPVMGDVAVLYLAIDNPAAVADTLLAIETDTTVAGAVSIHDEVAGEGGMTRMKPHGPLVVPAGESVRLEPGAIHGMLERLARPIHAGDSLAVTLRFARAGAVTLTIPVVGYGDLP